ncbi:MAG: sugar nucleotide-binding protein [Cellulosilyticaceae bacterium]
MHRILVLGGSGFLGKTILNELNKSNEFEVYGTYYKNSLLLNQNRSLKLDIENLDNIDDLLNALKPQSIVSCLRGNYDKQLILHKKIAEYLKKTNGKLYFCSTINVFDNDLKKSHYEDDLTDSCTDYGIYKIECEKIIQEILQQNVCILRLPQVWGKDSPRMNQLLKSLKAKEKIMVYPNLFLNTTTDIMIAKKLIDIIEHGLNGIFHIAADDVINHKDFCNELIRALGFNNARIEEDFETEGYFSILSNRNNEFHHPLRLTNELVIKHSCN